MPRDKLDKALQRVKDAMWELEFEVNYLRDQEREYQRRKKTKDEDATGVPDAY